MLKKSSSVPRGPDRGPYEVTTDRRRLVAPTDHLCALTDVGRVRAYNEDTFYLSPDGHLLIVADGMGGHEAGEVASELAVQAVVELLTGVGEKIGSEPEAIEAVVTKAVEAAHQRVSDAARTRAGCGGMGTTLILGYVRGDTLYTCHVGDVRCYVRTGDGLRRITRDHSVVGLLEHGGHLTADEARRHPQRNEILQAVGMDTEIAPELHTVPLHPGDRVLLCSDGLWEAVPDEDIRDILDADGSARQRATQLVGRANEAGGHDNITVVLYEHHPAEAPA